MAQKNDPSKDIDVTAEADILDTLPADLSGFYRQNRAALDTIVSADDVMAEALEYGLDEADLNFLGSVYRVAEKGEFVNRPFNIRAWRFKFGDLGPYAVLYCVAIDTNEMFIITDGSSGIHSQLEGVSRRRLTLDKPAFEFLRVPNGLRRSDYQIGEDGHALPQGSEEKGRPASTFYLA